MWFKYSERQLWLGGPRLTVYHYGGLEYNARVLSRVTQGYYIVISVSIRTHKSICWFIEILIKTYRKYRLSMLFLPPWDYRQAHSNAKTTTCSMLSKNLFLNVINILMPSYSKFPKINFELKLSENIKYFIGTTDRKSVLVLSSTFSYFTLIYVI